MLACSGVLSSSGSSSRLKTVADVSTPAPHARPRRVVARSSSSGGSSDHLNDEDRIWQQLAFPSYLQSKNKHKPEVCREFDKAVTAAERRQARDSLGLPASSYDDEGEEDLEPETAWHTIRREAERDAATEPLLSSFLYASILAHDTFERALAFVLSNRLANAVMLPTQLFEIFHEVLISEPDVREGALADVEACRERDPACTSYSQALLYYKGYHAIQTHRIAHALWMRGQKVMAVALQSRMSEVLAVDIHPAARFGRGILLDHGTGVVIGETAIIGNNVSLLQNVTLGGTGKDHGDRHPKISDNVLIGACATVLGNITVGEGAQIAAGSLVLKQVAPHTMVAGSPAKQVGHVTGNPAEKMQQWSKKLLNWDPFVDPPPAGSRQHQQQAEASSSAPAAADGTGATSSSSSRPATPLPKPTRATIAAAEAKWDAIAARMSATGRLTAAASTSISGTRNGTSSNGAGSSSNGTSSNGTSSNGTSSSGSSGSNLRVLKGAMNGIQKNGMHVYVSNGVSKSSTAAGSSSSSSSSNKPPAEQQQQQQQVQQHHEPLPQSRPAASSQPRQQQQQQQSNAQAAAAAAVQKGVEGMPVVAAAAAGRKQASSDLRGIHEGEVEATVDEEVAAEKWSSRKEEPEYVI